MKALFLMSKWIVSVAVGLWVSVPAALQLLMILSVADLFSSLLNPARRCFIWWRSAPILPIRT